MLKSGVCSVTFRQLSPEEVIQLAVKAGLNSIEWGGDIHVPAGDLETARRVGELTRAAGLEVAGYGSYMRCLDPAEIAPVTETAKALQAPVIRIWTGSTARKNVSGDDAESMGNVIRQLCDTVPEMTVASEFHRNTFTEDADSALEMVKLVDRKNYRSSFQLYAHHDIPSAVEKIEPFLGNVHVYSYEHAPLADTFDIWQNLMEKFKRQDRTLLLEFTKDNLPENFLADAETLKKLLQL